MRTNYIGILMGKTSRNKGSAHPQNIYYNFHVQDFYKQRFTSCAKLIVYLCSWGRLL